MANASLPKRSSQRRSAVFKAKDAPTLAPQTFALAFMSAVKQGQQGSSPGEDPSARSERALFALRQLFPNDDVAARAAWLRFNALMGLHSTGALGPFERQQDGGMAQFHPAVLDAASQMRLSSNGRFAPDKFLAMAHEIAELHYVDMTDWPVN